MKRWNGIGKEFDELENKIYEGEYLNGKMNGKIKIYYEGYLEYKGELLNGKRHGKGKEYYFGILIYDGYYLNGEKNGKGKKI